MADTPPVHLVKGSDPVLLGEATQELVDELVGDADRNEVLTEFVGDDYELGDVVMAATTVSMFGARVVVARNASRFGADQVAPLMQYLDNPSPDSTVVVSWEKPVTPAVRSMPVPKKLADAVKAAGGRVHDTSAPSGKGRSAWIDEQISASPVHLTRPARQVLVERIGDDVGRLGGILTVLEAVYGGQEVGPDELAPYLGDAGSVPPWELTDAIDSGDVAVAVEKVRRMLGGGERHPLQVMVTIQSHVERMLRLDGSGARDEKDAAKLLGMKGSTFPAKKAMVQTRRLGNARIVRAVRLVAAADVDLRGRTAQDGSVVVETLVARLAAISARANTPVGAARRGNG
jgi:DNA polymerase III subunit delta